MSITIGTTQSATVTIDAVKSVSGTLNTTLGSSGLKSLGLFVNISIDDPSVLTDVWINVSYANLNLGGNDPSTFKIYYFNENTQTWGPAGDTGVDTANKIIYAHVNHLSSFAAVAIPSASTTTTTTSSEPPTGSGSSSTSSSSSKPTTTITGVPGFELWIALLSFISIAITIRNRKKA